MDTKTHLQPVTIIVLLQDLLIECVAQKESITNAEPNGSAP